MAAFAVLAGLLFGFALDRSEVAGRDVAAALLWLIVLFASMGGAGRTFDPEEEDGAFRHVLLTPSRATPSSSARWPRNWRSSGS